MTPSQTLEPPPPDLGGYAVLDYLRRSEGDAAPGETFLAVAPGGRRVVLKTLDADCLLRNGLNPGIRDRLARVRELAHGGVANLHGVERDAGRAFLIWDYLDGPAWDEWDDPASLTHREFLVTARELAIAVEGLHARGIVHGAIHGRNIFITDDKRLRLTHVSPLLYNDPAEDFNAVLKLLQQSLERRQETLLPLARLVQEFADEADAASASTPARPAPTLRALASRLTGLIEQRESARLLTAGMPHDPPGDRQRRSRTLLGAAAVALLACGLYAGIRQYSVHSTPRTLAPLEAPAGAF